MVGGAQGERRDGQRGVDAEVDRHRGAVDDVQPVVAEDAVVTVDDAVLGVGADAGAADGAKDVAKEGKMTVTVSQPAPSVLPTRLPAMNTRSSCVAPRRKNSRCFGYSSRRNGPRSGKRASRSRVRLRR